MGGGDEEKGKSSAFGWILGIVLVVVLYVASIGPVFCCGYKFAISNQTLEKVFIYFYSPLNFVAEHNETFNDFIDWYIFGLWASKIFDLNLG